ncbi:DUF4129 domain-containing protein [Polaribacter haliotis]|uniref:DUF4129 domain-containing protein n=1 Tax=Polaribacter haliotis TaxID=1888915 RepID=A0A7L8AH66_9FLAO|nr:DUF4129 domain-containing protein [Polaribacter haliotis]QOD61346.1 DUF4129 domain-containing protein [Polaribacter haliotis]
MKNIVLLLFCVLFSGITISQETEKDSIEVVQDSIKDSKPVVKDSTIYIKSIEYSEKREFTDNLKTKYSDKDFIYTEEPEKEKNDSPPMNLGFLRAFVSFLKVVFPFLLGGFIIFVILKIALGSEIGFWNIKKGKKKTTEKLIYEDEDIHEIDLEVLLKQAIANVNYRLAIRYYYLSVLKVLSNKKLIDYHKEKTNSEYTFELENKELREQFSYLSYVYTYVWYGEFAIDKANFENVQQKYESFKNKVGK